MTAIYDLGSRGGIFLIVGSFYRPPAKAILSSIPVGTPLTLRPEPTNRVDPNAIAVWVNTSDIPEKNYKSLTLAGASCGFRIGEDPTDSAEAFLASILLSPSWHLGYIPAVVAKGIKLARPTPGRFIILNGKPAIETRETFPPRLPQPPRRRIELPPDSSDDDRRFYDSYVPD